MDDIRCGFRRALVTSAVLYSGGVAAQSLPEPAGYALLEEVTVTAQRRDENLSRTPVAVAVISAETLARAQIGAEDDLRAAAPGLSVRSGASSNQLNFALRGQSRDAFSGTRPGVLPYFNEVQIGGSGGSTAFYDLHSVQVLKGPQGTLFGRSATGGAVLFTTAKPTEQLTGYVDVLGGNYSAMKFEGAISGPIAGDRLLGRLAVYYNKRDGFQHNLYDGGREGDVKRYGARLSLTAKIGERSKNELVVDYFGADSENTVGVISGLLPFLGGGPGNPPFIPVEFLYSGTATPLARATGIGTLQAFVPPQFAPAAPGFYDAYFSSPQHPSEGLASYVATQRARGPYTVATDATNLYKAHNIVASNVSTFELNDHLTLKNVIGYTNLKYSIADDADGSPYGISSNGVKGSGKRKAEPTRQISEEVQLLGTAGKLSYVGGVYYSDEKSSLRQDADFFDLIFGGQSQVNSFTIKNRTIAGYAQGTYKIGEGGLSLTAGLRYTSEEVRKLVGTDDSIRVALGATPPPGFSYDQSKTYDKLSWQLGIQDQINERVLLYAVTRRAFKSGGYNGLVAPRVGTAATAGDAYDAEQVTDVEAGLKFAGEIGGAPARVNVAAFHGWVRNSQRTGYTLVFGNPAALTVNVPKGTTYGLELDGQIKPVKWLDLGGTLNFTKAKLANDTVFVNGSAQVFDTVTDTPDFSGMIFADVTLPIDRRLALRLHGDVYDQTESFTTPRSQNAAGTRIGSYNLANFRVGIEGIDGAWALTASVKNAFDKVYFVGGLPTGEIYQVNHLVPGEPRTVTMDFRYKF